MEFFQYLPLLMKLASHRAEIEKIQTLLGPTEAELKKVWAEVLPLITKLAGEMTTDLTSKLTKEAKEERQ